MQGRTRMILGIDAGTTSVKSVAFDLDGAIVSVARSSVHVVRGDAGEAEADMDGVWDAAASTIVAVQDEVRATGGEIVAIGITGQGDGAWLVDDGGRPLRPAALWLDGRAGAALDAWTSDGRAAAVQEATGSPLFPGALPVLVDALDAADAIDRSRGVHQLNCKDWLRYRLTGAMATDPSEASRTYLDTGSLQYPDVLLERVGQREVRAWLADVAAPESLAGTVLPAVASALGLPPGIPVAVGLVDTAAAGVGIGAIGDGDGYAILGTTGFVGVHHASRAEVRTDLGIVLATGRGDQVLECLAPMTGTPNLDWVRDVVGRGGESWPDVESDAAGVPPGSGGVVYLPYGSPSGERAPFADGAASASWLGMSVTTTQGQLLRSVYEGLAFSLRECLDVLRMQGSLAICGGGSDSDLLCQILADVTERPVRRQEAPEVGARGAATFAGIVAGAWPDVAAGVAALATGWTTFEPNRAASVVYRDAYATFVATRDALRPTWGALRALRESASDASRHRDAHPIHHEEES